MFKFATIGAFDNAINVPYCTIPATVTAKVYNGMGVTIDRATKTVALTTASETGDIYVVYNVQRTFDFDNSADFCMVAGDMPLVYLLKSLAGYEVEFSVDANIVAAPDAVAVGTTLVYGADGKLAAGTSDTQPYLKVLEIVNGVARAQVIG